MILPWVFSWVALKCGPWYPFWRVITSFWSQKTSSNLNIQGPASYDSIVVRRRPLSTVLYALHSSRKTRNRGSWSIIASSYAISSSRIAVPVTLPVWNPCRTSWRRTLTLRRVLMIVFVTFHSNSSRPITWVSVFTFVIRPRIVHPSSFGTSPWFHMN